MFSQNWQLLFLLYIFTLSVKIISELSILADVEPPVLQQLSRSGGSYIIRNVPVAYSECKRKSQRKKTDVAPVLKAHFILISPLYK